LLIRAAERGSNLGSITGALLRLLDRCGAAELQATIIEALDRNVPHPSAVRFALERVQRARVPRRAPAACREGGSDLLGRGFDRSCRFPRRATTDLRLGMVLMFIVLINALAWGARRAGERWAG
jgi:hypothetical protein